MAGADPELRCAGRAARPRLRLEAEDLGAELRRYADSLEAEPGRLDVVEERLELYDRLERKHGGSVAAVLAHAERCREEHARLAHAEIETERAEAALAEALAERDRLAKKVTAARRKAAPKLAERVREELAALAMEGAAFEVVLEPQGGGRLRRGAERVEFLLAPNPGVPAAPIRDAASGGELSRVMLALMTVAGAGESRTLVFDEVDAGVGGQTARAVGERLRALGEAPAGALHHPPAADRRARHERTSGSRSRPRPTPRSPRSRRSRATASSRSCAGCSAPRPPTRPPGVTPRSCSRPRESSAAPLSTLDFPET